MTDGSDVERGSALAAAMASSFKKGSRRTEGASLSGSTPGSRARPLRFGTRSRVSQLASDSRSRRDRDRSGGAANGASEGRSLDRTDSAGDGGCMGAPFTRSSRVSQVPRSIGSALVAEALGVEPDICLTISARTRQPSPDARRRPSIAQLVR
jgi:hypothetical protein